VFGLRCRTYDRFIHSPKERKMKIAENIVVGASVAFITITAGIGLVCACMPAFAQILDRVV
jgi:hypothetical protein